MLPGCECPDYGPGLTFALSASCFDCPLYACRDLILTRGLYFYLFLNFELSHMFIGTWSLLRVKTIP